MNQAYEDGRRANEFAKACREKYITDNMPKKKKPSKPNPEVIPNVPLWPGDLFDLPIGSISAHEFKRECLNEPEPEESQTWTDIYNLGQEHGVRNYIAILSSEIEKEKVKRGQPSEDLEVGKIIGLQIALQLLDSVNPKK